MPTKPGRSAAGQLGSSLGPAAQGPSRCAEGSRLWAPGLRAAALAAPDTSCHGQPKLGRFSSGRSAGQGLVLEEWALGPG